LSLKGTGLTRFGTSRGSARTPEFRGETACAARFVPLCPTFRDLGPAALRRLEQVSLKGAKLAKELTEK
jgi:hypothetical protein